MKTFELSGVQLDWAVAKAEGYPDEDISVDWNYSTDWRLGGSLIERECIDLEWTGIPNANFFCTIQGEYEAHGTTPLIAAMRCYVASRLGDEVEIPDDLLEEEE
jgi:hypothetical protein